MALTIEGPIECKYAGMCIQCLGSILPRDFFFEVKDDAHPREAGSVCSRECGDSRMVSLAIAGDHEAKARAIRRGQP